MNALQIAQQIVSSLRPTAFKWGSGAQEAVLSRVVVGPATPDFFQQDFVAPGAVLHVETGRDSDEHPADLVEEQRFTLYLFTANASEMSGSAAVVGGNREDLGSSSGRGLLEIEPLVKQQIFNATGLTARPRTTGGQATAYAGKMGGVVAERALEIVATRIPSLPDSAPVRRLKSSVGPVAFPGTLVANRATGGAGAVTTNGTSTFTVVNNAGSLGWELTANIGAWTWYVNPGNTFFPIGANATATAALIAAAFNATLDINGGVEPFANHAVATSSGPVVTITSSANTVSLTWATAPSRYDLVGYTWARAAGAVAPTSPTGGTFVADPTATSLVNAPGAGTWSYAIFWAFDQTIDPFTATGVVPVAPNAWSSQQSSQAGLAYLPATATVTV